MAKSKKVKGPIMNYGRHKPKPTRLDAFLQSACMKINNAVALLIRN